jgi:hypothetical protein
MAKGWRKKKVMSLAEAGVDPLKLVPAPDEGCEARKDSQGLIQLQRRFKPAGRIYRWLAGLLRYQHKIQLKLDEAGSAFWEKVDGRRDLGRIAAEMSRQFGSELPASRKAAVEFARTLTQKKLIHLILPAQAGKQEEEQEQEENT